MIQRDMLGGQLDELVALRRDLHAHPQLAYEETYASGRVCEYLKALDIPFEAGIAETGVVGWITPSGQSGRRKAIALRADMDALPITEETGLPHASQNPGIMHACGHDGHTTVLLGAARALNDIRDQLPQPIKLIFQPAEEGGAGANRMVNEGALTAMFGGVETEAIYGLHGWPEINIGQYATRPGALMASTNSIRMRVTSTGGHAAMPHLYADTIVCASAIVTALQTIASRNVKPTDPVVVSITMMHGGDAVNVVPAAVELGGTIRTVTPATRQFVCDRVKAITQAIAQAHGCAVEVDIREGYPVTYNDAACVDRAKAGAVQLLGDDNVFDMSEPVMGAEDFSYYGQHVPACFGFVGLKPIGATDAPGLHTPKFDFNDEVLPIAIQLMCQWATGHDS